MGRAAGRQGLQPRVGSARHRSPRCDSSIPVRLNTCQGISCAPVQMQRAPMGWARRGVRGLSCLSVRAGKRAVYALSGGRRGNEGRCERVKEKLRERERVGTRDGGERRGLGELRSSVQCY